ISDADANSVLYGPQDVAVRRHARAQCVVVSAKPYKTRCFALGVGLRCREKATQYAALSQEKFCELRRKLRYSAENLRGTLRGLPNSPRVRDPGDAPATTPRASRGSTPSSRSTRRARRD